MRLEGELSINMLEILRDGVWQFIGAAASLAALVIATMAFLAQIRKKSLSYTITTDSELLHRNDVLSNHVTIQYDGLPIQRLRLLSVRFRNDGGLPIASKDFEEPIRIRLDEQSNILSCTVSDNRPSDLPVAVDVSSNVVTVNPLLLNRADQFSVQLIVGESVLPPSISGRVVGVTEIQPSSPHSWMKDAWRQLLPFYVLMVIGVYVIVNALVSVVSRTFFSQ